VNYFQPGRAPKSKSLAVRIAKGWPIKVRSFGVVLTGEFRKYA
jgi:hypothetical protein